MQIAGPWGQWTPGLLMGRTLANLTLLGAFVGIAEAARDLALDAATNQTKPKFGGALRNNAGFVHRVGEIEIAVAAAAGVLSHTADGLDDLLARHSERPIHLDTAHTCMKDYQCAKWTVHDSTVSAVSMAMDVVGGRAYTRGHPLERLYRDVRAGSFMQPFSPTEARDYVGRVALDIPPDG